VLEDISRRIRARALFATHYLELAAVADEIPSVANVHVAALEREGRVVFLYAVQPGPADRAYGIQVARLAGLPGWVADRAEDLLREAPRSDRSAPPRPRKIAEHVEECEECEGCEESGFQPAVSSAAERLAAALRSLDLDETSPRQALAWLWEQQERLADEGAG
jgi:DNA mismatch repair protein MutS